jgi:hypothetical protein
MGSDAIDRLRNARFGNLEEYSWRRWLNYALRGIKREELSDSSAIIRFHGTLLRQTWTGGQYELNY